MWCRNDTQWATKSIIIKEGQRRTSYRGVYRSNRAAPPHAWSPDNNQDYSSLILSSPNTLLTKTYATKTNDNTYNRCFNTSGTFFLKYLRSAIYQSYDIDGNGQHRMTSILIWLLPFSHRSSKHFTYPTTTLQLLIIIMLLFVTHCLSLIIFLSFIAWCSLLWLPTFN